MFHAYRYAALTATLLLPLAAQAGDISLTGHGSVRYTPDSARLEFTASAQHSLASKASEQVQQTMDQWRQAIEPLHEQLVDYSDARVNLYTRALPTRQPGQKSEQVAVANQTISFSVHNLELLNPLLEQAQKLGLQYHLGQQQFFHSDAQGLEREALARAIQDARERCQFAASQLEKRCGEVKSININGGGHRPAPMMMAEARGASESISSIGVRDIQANVNATFELD